MRRTLARRTISARWLGLALILGLSGCPQGAGTSSGPSAGSTTSAPAGSKPMVVLSTSLGDVVLELDAEKAPISVENFLKYVDDGFFDGTIFHRVIPGFMIQGGGFTQDMQQKKTRAPVQNEAKNGLLNEPGTIAMARTSDPNSATAQFFINLVDNQFLNHGARDFGYAVFGRVAEGMDVVKKIGAVATANRGGMGDVPIEPVIIQSAKRKP